MLSGLLQSAAGGSASSRKREVSRRAVVLGRREDMYAVVQNVEEYPQFLPYNTSATLITPKARAALRPTQTSPRPPLSTGCAPLRQPKKNSELCTPSAQANDEFVVQLAFDFPEAGFKEVGVRKRGGGAGRGVHV